jgi:hypothetical protein
VLLSAPADVLLTQIEPRTTNDYGKQVDERERIVSGRLLPNAGNEAGGSTRVFDVGIADFAPQQGLLGGDSLDVTDRGQQCACHEAERVPETDADPCKHEDRSRVGGMTEALVRADGDELVVASDLKVASEIHPQGSDRAPPQRDSRKPNSATQDRPKPLGPRECRPREPLREDDTEDQSRDLPRLQRPICPVGHAPARITTEPSVLEDH